MVSISHLRRCSCGKVRIIVGRLSFCAVDSTMKAALVFGNRYPASLSFCASVSFVSVQKQSLRCEWMCMLRSALKFAVRMQKHSS